MSYGYIHVCASAYSWMKFPNKKIYRFKKLSFNPNFIETNKEQEICGNHIKARFFNVIIQNIAVHGTND